MAHTSVPSFEEVRRDLVATLYGLAYVLDLHVRPGAGGAALGLKADTDLSILNWPTYDDFDLSEIMPAAGLETIYRYAFHGELDVLFISDDEEEGNLGTLQSLVALVHSNHFVQSAYEEACEEHDQHNPRREGLREMLKLAIARNDLDTERQISLAHIALLANMDERSVRNALHATGETRLAASRNEAGELFVEKTEALRWLRGRRGFKETVRVGTWPQTTVPERLTADEIVPFIAGRLEEYHGRAKEGYGGCYANAGRAVGWAEERVRAIATGTLDDVSPDDCATISRMIYVDTQWFTAQVMQAKFPRAMKELVAVTAHPGSMTRPSAWDEHAGTLDVTLTDAGVRNGYFDIDSRYARFFPADSLGARSGDHHGAAFELRYDNSSVLTDVRVKSAGKLSLRKRFTSYFRTHKATAGDRIQIKRIDERTYKMTFVPKEKATV